MVFHPFKKNSLFLLALVIFSALFYFSNNVFPPIGSVHAQDAGHCESDYVFNGGDAGDENSWEYVGSCDDYYHENSDDSEYLCDKAGGDWDGDRCRTSSSSDNPRDESCPTERWDDSQTSGEYYCRDGQACYKKWKQLNSCDIVEDGWSCQDVDSDHECSNSRDSSCPITPQYPECRDDGLVYQTFKDCNGEWVSAKPTGDRCAGGGGSADDNEENSGACPSNQYWDINTGQCQNPTDQQAAINDEIYCREECGGQCAGQLGAKYCVNDDGSNRYDCSDPANLDQAECRNELINEFAIIGLEPENTTPPVTTTPSNPSNPCEVDPSSEYCQTQTNQANQAQSFQQNCENGGDGSYYQECDWATHSVRAVCKVGNNFETRDLGQQPGLCKADPSAGNRVYCSNISCGEGFHCEVSSSNVAECKPNYDSAGEAVVSSSSNQPKDQLITVLDAERNIRLVGHTLKFGPDGGPAKATSVCRELQADPTAHHNCLVEYYRSNPSEMEFQTPQSQQQGRDESCRSQTPAEHYCDGNVCIEKSSGWDGSACVPVYKTVAQSNCNNSCTSDTPQSGQEIKLISCIDQTDPAKRAECNQENARIVQTGQTLNQASLIKASLQIDDCSSLEDEVKKACENKNEETRFLGRVLDNVSLENCAGKSGDEKSACDKRNADTIRAGQIRLNLGIEDCSALSGDKKTNCEFKNYQNDQITQAVISFKPEDCSIYQTAEEKAKCLENNQKGLSQAVSNSSAFVGLAEVGASCVYTEACQEGGKKACAGKVENNSGAPVCRYDPAAASCSACTTGTLDLTNKENKCSEDGQTCLNGPGLACISDAQCQNRLAAAQQAAANAPIDPAKFFSQKFEEGATCLQPQTCDLGDGNQGEQVCYGKGNAEGKCDLSQGGGVCSDCQAKGSIKLNREASCNAENKCVGAPALSGCMNDEQCKPVLVAPGRTIQQGGVAGPGQVIGKDQCVYNAVTSCKTIETRAADYYTTSFSGSPDARDLNRDKAVEQHQECFTDYIQASCPTYITEAPVYASQAVTNHVQYNYAVTEASNLTNKLDQYGAAVVRDLGYIPPEIEKIQADQQAAIEKLKQAEKALNLLPQVSEALDRSTTDARVAGLDKINRILDLEKEVGQSIAQTAAARNQFNQDSIGNSADSEAVAQRYDEFEKIRQSTQDKINQLAAERGESGKGVSQIFQNQLDQLPTKTDAQFKDQLAARETAQLSNLARQSSSGDVVAAAQDAMADRVEELGRRGSVELAAGLQRQAVQASFDGWLNVYANKLSQSGGNSKEGGTANSQINIQNLIDTARISDPQAAEKMEKEYSALPSFVAALNLANEIKRETVGTFAGTVNQDNNSAFYSAIANAEEQAKSREDLANLVDRTCTLSAQRCTTLQNALGITNPNATPDQIADSVIGTSQSDGARAANLLVEQSRLLPQLYQVERAGDANNIDQLTSLLGRSNQIKTELAQIDPNLAVRAQAQVQEVIAQGKAQNQLDYAANTYANNKELLLAFDKANQNGIGGLNNLDPVAEAEAAKARMQNSIDQMRTVSPEKADAMQSDFDLTKFKLDSFTQGSAMVDSDGCVIEACLGNGSTAQNICTGQVAAGKSFNRICAVKNGVVNPGEAAQLELDANRQTSNQANIQANEEANNFLKSLENFSNDFRQYNQFGLLGLAKGGSDVIIGNYQNGNLTGIWQGAVALPSTIGSMFTDWRARAVEGSIPVFTGTPEEQLACRDLWQNTRVQGAQQIQRGESSLGCTIDNRSDEEKSIQAAQIANNGGTVIDIFSSLEGVKANSDLRQRTLQRAAEEAGVNLDSPIAYWTPTQRDKFYEKLKGLDNAGAVDVFDAIVFPTAALSEAQSAMERCNKDWGQDLCQLDSNLAATYQGIAQGDVEKYNQTINNAKVLNPGLADVPQSDFAWVVDGISKQQRGGVIDLMTAGEVPSRDQFESDDAYFRAITADLAEKGGTGLTREQLINRLLLDANRQGINSADGSAMSREDISNAVDAYLAIGDFGRNVVNTSEAYQWQRSATTEFDWQLAQDVIGLATVAGPLEMLDPTNPIVEVAIKGITKTVSVPTRAVTGLYDNVLERIGTNTAKNVLEETYGLTRAESNAISSFYNGRIAEKSVAQSVAELTPAQQLAFGQATDKIGAKLGLTETPDHLIASTILDNILKPQVVNPSIIADRGRVIAALVQEADYNGNLTRDRFDQLVAARLIQPAEVEALAAKGVFNPLYTLIGLDSSQAEVLGRQVAQEVLTTQKVIPSVNVAPSAIDDLKTRAVAKIAGEPEARVRVVNSQVDGIRVGQATDEENRLIATILEPDPAARTNAGQLVQRWNNLNPDEKELILDQVAREVAVNQAAARDLTSRTPTSGNQALIQLAEQSKAFSAGNTSPALTNALTSASVVVPKVADVVVKIADGTPLNVLDQRALELAGVSESSLKKNIDPLNPTAKLKVLSTIQADPAVIARSDLETVLLNQGLTSNQASMLATTLQPLAPTPPAPAAQPGFLARIADTFNTLTGRNSTPVSQTIPNTNTVANTNTNQTPPQTTATFSVNDSGSAAFENRRGGQGRPAYPRQDREVVQTQFRGNENEGLFAVFDGHGTAADQLAESISQKLPDRMERKLAEGKTVEEALIESFKEIDDEIPANFARTAGSTGTVVYRQGNDIWVVNVGDSPALLSKNGQVQPVYTAHNGRAYSDETDAQGRSTVVAVNRGFGDKGHFDLRTGKEVSAEITTADITKITPTTEDEFIVITSDGVFEGDLTEQEAIDIVRFQLQAGKSPQEAAQVLAKAAFDEGNTDDITVVVVPLKKAAQSVPAQQVVPAPPGNTANITTAPPLTPANPTIPNAPGVINRALTRVAGWLQVAERPLNWLSGAPSTPRIITAPPLDPATAAQISARLTSDLSALERQAVTAAQQYQDKVVERVLVEAEIKALNARRSYWINRTLFNRGSDLEIQLGLKKDQLDQINKELPTLKDDLQSAQRDLERARIDLKQANQVVSPASVAEQQNLRSSSSRQLAQRQRDLQSARKQLELTKSKTPQTAADKLAAAQDELVVLEAQLARDGDNITGFTADKQQIWLEALQKVKELEADSSTSKAVLDQAREDLRQARSGMAFRNISEEKFFEALSKRNDARLEYDKAFTAVNDVLQDVNRLTLDVHYYTGEIATGSQIGNQINNANRRLLNTLAPADGFSPPSGFSLWSVPAQADIAFFMDTTGRLGIDDTGKQGIWVIAKYRKGSDGAVALDRVVVPHTAPQNLRDAAKAATPGKWIPGKLSGDLQVLPEAQFNQALSGAQRVNTQQVPIVINPAPAAAAQTTADIEKGAVNDLFSGKRLVIDRNTGESRLLAQVSDDQIRLTLINRGYDPDDPALDEAVRRISDQINPRPPAQPNPPAAANPAPAAPAPTAPVAPPAASTRITFDDLLEAPETLSPNQRRYYDDLQFEKYFEDAHGVLFHSTDPADVAKIKGELGLPQNYSETDYFRQLEDLRNQRLQSAASLGEADERAVRASLGRYLPRDVEPVSISTPVATVQTNDRVLTPRQYIQLDPSTVTYQSFMAENPEQIIDGMIPVETVEETSDALITSNQTSTVYTIKGREKGGPSQDALGVSRRGDGVINLVVADGVGQALVPDFTSRLATGRVLEALSDSTLSDDIFDYAWSLIQDPVHRQIGQSLIDSNPNLAPIIRSVLQEKIARNQIGATTLSVVQYTPSTGIVRYGAHGDSPIIIFRADGSAPQVIEGNINGQLGYAPGSRYNPNGLLSGEVTLRQGDVVLVMSDGTSEGRYPGLYQSIADQVRAGASEAEIGDFIASRIRTDGIKDDVSVGILKQKSAPVSEAVSPVQAVVEPIVSAVDDAASAVRAAGNGTPIQPVTDAAANLIESVSGVGDDINRVITGSPSTRDELIEQSRLLNERLTQLEAQERQLKREYDQLYQERDEIIDQSDRADLNTADQNQLSQELSELNAEMSRVYDEITAVQNEWFQAIDELDEINIRINESSFVDEVEDAINFPSGVAASRLEDLAGFARATGNTDLAESLKNAADAIRRSIQSSDEAAVTRRVLTEKEQDAIEYIFGSHRTIELDGRRMIYEWSEVTDQEIKEALIAVGLNENADLTASIRRVSQELNDPLLPIISNPVDYTPQVSEPVQVTQFVPPQVVPEQAFEDALDDLSGYARIFDGFTPNEIPEDTIREVLYKRGFTGTPEEWDEAVKRIDRQVNSPLLPILDNIDVPGTPLGTVAGAYRFTSALFDEADRLVNGVETPSAGRLPNAAPGTDITISQISESSRNWYRPTGGGGAGATTLINDDLGLVAKYAQSPDAIFNLQAELAVVDNSTGLFPKVINRVVNNRGEVVGYVMEKINGVPLSQYGVDNLPHAAKIALLYKLAQFYEEKGIPRMDVGINFGEHFWVETLPSGRVRVRSIDPLPRAVSNLGFYDEVRAIIDGVPLTDKQKIVLQAQIDLEVEKIIAKLGLPDDVAVKTIKEIIAENKMRALDAYSYSIGKSNTRPVIQTLDEMLQDAEYVEIFTDGRSSFRNAKNYGWDEPVSQSGQLCDLVSIPSQSTLAQANQATNVLGVSSGEVLAASTGPCGPFATAWLEMSKSQGGKVLDDMTAGKLFDTYTDIFVKMDASLPEPVLNMGNKVIGLFKKSTDNLDQVAKITPAPAVEEIPILKPLVEETPKFSKKLSADEQFISEYFDQIKTGQVADGQIMLYFDPNSGKIVTTNVSASDIVPFEIQIFRNADSSLDIASLKIPSDYAYGESLYSIINTLEKLTDSRVLHINETSKQKLFALEGTIPAIIQPDLVTMTSVLLTKPDVARLYANRQIEQNWLNKNLENLLGDNYINLRQKALPPPDPYLEVPKQLDTTYSQYKAGEINETQLIEQVESIAGIHSQSQKIQEIPLFIDERFLRTGLLAGRDLEDIKHWFGAGEWAGWLGARKVAQSYGDRPLSTSFIQNLHQALLIPASTKEDVLVGDFRLNAMFGFKKDNPGEFPISKIKVINENPYLKFIETPVPEGKMARPDETKWGYIQYPRVGDADFMNSLPEHIKAKLSPRPTNQELVQVLVEDVIDWYNTQSNLPGVDRVALAAELQRRLISVHPFGDANGRLSRIVMNWSLENAGYPAPRIVNFNADIETPLAQWIETVRNGISREQKVQEKLKLMEEIGWVDPVEALGYSELKTFYDLMAKNGKFANSSRLLPEVNGQIKRTPYGSLNDLNRDIVLAWNNFHKMFGGESQVLTDGTKITVGGLVPQSYIDLVRLKNPKNFEAYEKLIKDFYSNRDVTVYRGMHFSIPADTPKRVAALFETPRPAWNSYYSHTFSSPKSPRFLRLDTPNMSSSDVIKESLVKGLEEYNRTVIDDYTDILDDETIQMEDKIDSLRRKIKIHAIGDSTNTEVSPFVSLSTNRGIADGFAGGSYKNPFFNQYSGKPNKRQAGILVTAKLPAQGVIPTFNTGYQTFGFDGVPPQIIPGIGGQLSVHTGEFEILVPGGINPAHIERIQVKVRTNDQTDPSWKSYKFDAVKSIKEDGIYVEVKEMVIGSDGYPTGEVKQTTHFKLNPSNGKYEEVSTINTVEDILNSIKNNPFLTGSTTTSFATP